MNIGIAANNPNPAPKSRRWADVARGWKHNPSPAVFPRPNPPRVGKGKATGFLRVLQEASERHRRGKAGQDITLPLPNPKHFEVGLAAR